MHALLLTEVDVQQLVTKWNPLINIFSFWHPVKLSLGWFWIFSALSRNLKNGVIGLTPHAVIVIFHVYPLRFNDFIPLSQLYWILSGLLPNVWQFFAIVLAKKPRVSICLCHTLYICNERNLNDIEETGFIKFHVNKEIDPETADVCRILYGKQFLYT